MPYESDLALRLPPHSPSVSVSAHVRDKPCRRLRSANASIRYRSSGKPDLRRQLPPGGSLCPHCCLSAFMLHVPYRNKVCDQKAPSGRELSFGICRMTEGERAGSTTTYSKNRTEFTIPMQQKQALMRYISRKEEFSS